MKLGPLVLIGGMVLLAATGGTRVATARHHGGTSAAAVTVSARTAISYAKAQLGKPYVWGGAGPDSFDCSGLVQQAYKWGASLRTSQQQWAGLRHLSSPRPGDLVFFTGALQPGELPPVHVGIVTGSHEMIDAYAPGFGVEYDSFGIAGSKQGLGQAWGYASP